MIRPAWLLLPALAACSHAPRPPAAASDGAAPAVCRIGPDGGRPVADRGIGGTGAPARDAVAQAAPPRVTRVATQPGLSSTVEIADRGIGGTGIIGVITGFASVCIAGQEVALPAGVTVRVDDRVAGLDDLRAGQVAALAASGAGAALSARTVAVMHAVIGPVERRTPARLTVAGQQVDVTAATGNATAAAVGDWVAVSGLHQPGGVIVATRIDRAPAGRALVRGELVQSLGAARIGALPVRLPDGMRLPGGWSVTVAGALEQGVLVADSASMDVADDSPSAYFGPAVTNFIVEAYVDAVPGGLAISRDFVAAASMAPFGRRIVSFSRGADGRLTSLDAGEAFQPAPVPAAAGVPSSSGLENRAPWRGPPPSGPAGPRR